MVKSVKKFLHNYERLKLFNYIAILKIPFNDRLGFQILLEFFQDNTFSDFLLVMC